MCRYRLGGVRHGRVAHPRSGHMLVSSQAQMAALSMGALASSWTVWSAPGRTYDVKTGALGNRGASVSARVSALVQSFPGDNAEQKIASFPPTPRNTGMSMRSVRRDSTVRWTASASLPETTDMMDRAYWVTSGGVAVGSGGSGAWVRYPGSYPSSCSSVESGAGMNVEYRAAMMGSDAGAWAYPVRTRASMSR